jgi:hypothetical protein
MEPMTMAEATAFVAKVPWTFAKTVPHMPHEYVIREWREVPTAEFDAFVNLIRERGYRAVWTHPDRGVRYTNTYLDLGEWAYWFIEPNMLNRERLEHATRERVEKRPEQLGLDDERSDDE